MIEEHASDLVLDEILVSRRARPAHLDGCARCQARLEALRAEREAFSRRARPAAFADAILARRPRVVTWRWGLPLAAAAALIFVLQPRGEERVKGAPANVELYVRSGDKTERHDPGRRYASGDALQPIYSASGTLFLTAVNLDANGARLLVNALSLPAGARRALDRSFVLDESAGDERLFFLFSERPLDDQAVLSAARQAVRDRPAAAIERLAVETAAQTSFLIRR
jgi:hypothetical protein